ncbi:hypothetical protein CRH02_15110 [Escherichia albertii]|nr:hypothetical protein CRH02_15110 [Escherichia albertii]
MRFDTTVAKKAKNEKIFDTTDFCDFNVLNRLKNQPRAIGISPPSILNYLRVYRFQFLPKSL